MDKKIIKFWQKLAKEQNLIIFSIAKCYRGKVKIKQFDEYNLEYKWENLNCKLQIDKELIAENPDFLSISDNLVKFLMQDYGELLDKKQLPCKWQWSKILIIIITFLLSVTIGIGSYCYLSYQKAYQQEKKLTEHIALVQQDLDVINELKPKEQIIEEKQKLIQDLEAKSIKLYPILANLGAYTVSDVALVEVEMNSHEILLSGIAKNAEAVTQYSDQLSQLKFINTIKVKDIKLDEHTNLWNFVLILNNEVKE